MTNEGTNPKQTHDATDCADQNADVPAQRKQVSRRWVVVQNQANDD